MNALRKKYQGAPEFQGGEEKKLTIALDACWERLRRAQLHWWEGYFKNSAWSKVLLTYRGV